MAKQSHRRCDQLPVLHPDAAGIDVGASDLFVAAGADRDSQPVRRFPTFTRDLHALADWLQHCGVRSVAMESTSVYWIPIYQILEARCSEVCLVNAQHVKNVPGRKTDVLRLPVASVPALCRFAPSQLPAAWRDLRCTRSLAAPRQPGPDGC
jgi:transposase